MNDYDRMSSDTPDKTVTLDDPANFEQPDFTEDMILKWAQEDTGGGLPAVSALAFASWLDRAWNDFYDEETKQTNADVLHGAWETWTGRS